MEAVIVHRTSELGLKGPAGVLLIKTQGIEKVIPDGGRRDPTLETKAEGRSLKSFYATSRTLWSLSQMQRETMKELKS